MKFHFNPSEDLKKQHYIETGNRRMDTFIEVDDTALTPEQRAGIVATEDAMKDMQRTPFIRRVLGEMSINWNGGVVHASMDNVPTPEEAIQMYIDLLQQIPAIREAKEAHKAEEARKREERKRKVEEMQRIHREEITQRAAERAAERAQRVEAAKNITWSTDDKAVLDLLDTLFILSGDEQDDRFNNWAKTVTDVKQYNDNGYDFVGDFVRNGTVEIERKKTVYLVASTNGSRKYNTTIYRVIVLNPESGQFERTDITTDNDTPGWALRIRDDVKALLNS